MANATPTCQGVSVTNDPVSSIPARHNRKWQNTVAPLRRGLSWLGSKPDSAQPRRRWVLPAAFVATALVAGAAGFLLNGGEPTADQAPLTAASASPSAGTGTSTGTGTQAGNQAMDAVAVFNRLVAAGLPMTNPVSVDASTDPNKLLGRKGGYTSRLSFSLPGGDSNANQYGIGRGGIIEVFANTTDARKRYDSIRKEGGSRSGERDYRAGVVLVRVDGHVDRALTDKVNAAVAALDKAT